jgi:two-component system response regulator AtoC
MPTALAIVNAPRVTMSRSMTQRVLLLGPEDEARRALHVLAAKRGYDVAAASDIDTARKHFAAAECDVVLAQADLAAECCKLDGAPPVIAVLKSRDPAHALSLIDGGARDVISEPIDDLAIALALRGIVKVRKANGQTNGKSVELPDMIGDSAPMQKLKATLKLIAPQRTTVLILGESGTGKELVARSIHALSPRKHKRFVAINCAAIPASLLESELFGHVKGAFTDASRDKPGLFEDADGGTLFLDEVGELPMPLQAKLLRALQDSEIRRVGDSASVKVDVRLIAATLRDLTAEVAAGRFREDLFYRLNVLPVAVPALRDRPDDVAVLARFFTERHAARHGRKVELTDAAIEALARQPWPGNVRELENVIERALVLADGPSVDVDFLATMMTVRTGTSPGDDGELSIKKATRSLEQELIKRALGVTQGNRTNAAKLLEISHRALLYKMKEYGIS